MWSALLNSYDSHLLNTKLTFVLSMKIPYSGKIDNNQHTVNSEPNGNC